MLRGFTNVDIADFGCAFNAYRRGRINWDIGLYLTRLQERYFNRYSEAFQFFFFLSDYMNYDLGVDLFDLDTDLPHRWREAEN